MDSGKALVSLLTTTSKHGNFMDITILVCSIVASPPVSMDHTSLFYIGCYKIYEAVSRGIWNHLHSNPPDALPILFSSDYHQRFFFGLPATDFFLQAPNVRFIYFNSSRQFLSSWAHHGPPQLVQACPSCLVADSKNTFEPQRASPVLLCYHPPDSTKPHWQRKVCVLEYCPGDHRGLIATHSTFECFPHFPISSAAATRARITVWPS
jgi:hypothetical protein